MQKRIIISALVALLATGTAIAQTASFRNGTSIVKSYSLKDVSRITYIPPDSETYIDPETVENLDMFMPNVGSASGYYSAYGDLFDKSKNYNFYYMKQSEHFFLFWDKQFGEDPKKLSTSHWGYVDTDKLLEKAEDFFNTNINTLGMATLGTGESWLDDYKMQIWLIYDSGWTATGSGWGNIGCLWITPQTCKSIGLTIAHEIGHAFQHQTGADRYLQQGGSVSNYSFRYAWGYGCGYWEQCAQWQALQDYPEEMFTQASSNWVNNYHRHFCHEWMRYQSFWWQYWLVQQQGLDAYASIWKEAYKPEDPLEVSCRLYHDNDWDSFWDDYYQYASHMLTYDIETVRDYRAANSTLSTPTRYSTNLIDLGGTKYQVAYASAPETSGMNFIRLELPDDGNVSIDFQALDPGCNLAEGDPGTYYSGDGVEGGTTTCYNNISGQCNPDFRYGYVAIDSNGNATYGEMHHGTSETVSFTVPEGTASLYFVVVPSPATYNRHEWDDNDLNDIQWPYTINVSGTNVFGHYDLDYSAGCSELQLEYTVECDPTLSSYYQGTIDFAANGDLKKIAQAFLLQPSEIIANTGTISTSVVPSSSEGRVVYMYENPDGNLASGAYTATYGFYINADGTKGSWSEGSPLFVEYDKGTMIFTYGSRPNDPASYTSSGDSYTVRPCLVYKKDGVEYRVTITIHMNYK